MRKGFVLPLILAVVAIVLIAVGVIAYIQLRSKFTSQSPEVTQPTPNPTITPSATPSPTINDETVNWKTYTNDEFKYSIKVPNDWIVSPMSIRTPPDTSDLGKAIVHEASIVPNKPLEGIPASLVVTKENLATALERREKELSDANYKISKEEILLGKTKVIKLNLGPPTAGYDYFAEKDSYSYHLTGVDEASPFYDTLKLIFSTFKFLD